MGYLLGLIVATVSLIASITHLQQSYQSYWDFVAFVMVLGGTLAVAMIILPWDLTKEIRRRLQALLFRISPSRRDLLRLCLQLLRQHQLGQPTGPIVGSRLEHELLRDGFEMVGLGLKTDAIEAILRERIVQATDRTVRVANSFRSLAKYPPAFGLAGTVLGLVHLMTGVAAGISTQETGTRMAIALVATMYGLLVANLVVSPAGESIQKMAMVDEKMAEMALQAVLLAADGESLLAAQELLNSYVMPHEREDILRLLEAEGEAA